MAKLINGSLEILCIPSIEDVQNFVSKRIACSVKYKKWVFNLQLFTAIRGKGAFLNGKPIKGEDNFSFSILRVCLLPIFVLIPRLAHAYVL